MPHTEGRGYIAIYEGPVSVCVKFSRNFLIILIESHLYFLGGVVLLLKVVGLMGGDLAQHRPPMTCQSHLLCIIFMLFSPTENTDIPLPFFAQHVQSGHLSFFYPEARANYTGHRLRTIYIEWLSFSFCARNVRSFNHLKSSCNFL